jgi:ubiquinone/menaquinone biosynthesis C-methylase UbiE
MRAYSPRFVSLYYNVFLFPLTRNPFAMANQVLNVYETSSKDELARLYDDWADSYDADLDGMGGPAEAVALMAEYVSLDSRILDAGCGTGVVGQLLAGKGFRQVDGLDLSVGMLDEARKKNCYANLYQQALGETLDMTDDQYDAVSIVGVFVRGHVGSNAFEELIRITRPGGFIVFTLRPEFRTQTDFHVTMDALEASGKWQLKQVTEPFSGRFKAHPEVNLQVWVYQVV